MKKHGKLLLGNCARGGLLKNESGNIHGLVVVLTYL
jgi:hypothetical protein